MIFVIESSFGCSSFKLCLVESGEIFGWKEVEPNYSNVVCGNAGFNPVEVGGDVDLVALSLLPLLIHSKHINPTSVFTCEILHIRTSIP